jgi:hypothetical protein
MAQEPWMPVVTVQSEVALLMQILQELQILNRQIACLIEERKDK